MKTNFVCALLALGMLATACKKSKTTPAPEPVKPPTGTPTATRQQLTADSIFLYAKEIYLWNDKLPTYQVFNPRKYTNFDQELFEITKYSNPYDYIPGDTESKYSYIFDTANKNQVAVVNAKSSVDLEGNGNDFGIKFDLYGNYNNYTIYAAAIYSGSPADKAGLIRGDKITKINGIAYGMNYTDDTERSLNNAINSNSINIEGIKSNGNNFTLTLNKTVFKSSPIYKKKIITAGTKKIGYLAYARFSNEANSVDTLNKIFNEFSVGGVTDLIIDLRYNGGGYVQTAEHLINLIAPSTATGVMFTEYFNATMQAGNATILKNQPLLDGDDKLQYYNGKVVTYADLDYSPRADNKYTTSLFDKAGSLSTVQNVVFIVSGNTASASELVINSLKPKMNVKMVGDVTYGKPVGFFPITIENKYEVYYAMFETKNSLGQGGYFNGITPDIKSSEVPINTIMYDFGDSNDNYTKLALNVLAPGVTVPSMTKTMSLKQQKSLSVSSSEIIKTNLVNEEFKGMIDKPRYNRYK